MNISSILFIFATSSVTKFLTVRISEKKMYGKKNSSRIWSI